MLAVLLPWYVVTRLGVGAHTDAFFASGALPQLIFVVVSFSVGHVLIPLLATEEEKTFRRDAWGFFLGVTGFFTLLALVLGVTAGFWVPLLVPGFSSQAKQLTVTLSRIQLLAMIGNAAVAVLWSVYFARQRFIWAELSSVLANVLALLYLFWLLPVQGVAAAAWATSLNLVLKVLLLMPVLGRWQRPQWDSDAMKEAWRRVKPFLFGQTYSRTDPLIDRFLTSLSVAGNLSMLYIGQQIYSAINLVITKAISTPTVPRLAIAAKSRDWPRFRHIYRGRLVWMIAITIVSAILLLIFGQPVLRLLIGHGGITAGNVRTLWWIMIALLGVMVGGTVGQVTSVAFYAMGDTKTPTNLFILTFTIYIPIKVLVFMRYGLIGLAVATSVHLVLNFLLQLAVLERMTSPARMTGLKVPQSS
jgi:peptidoglycan biosynthesis protein MviN/MurJ (putative lipid II flippase)